jgi:pimeloyl-ACP methyl ester carboxylesterase
LVDAGTRHRGGQSEPLVLIHGFSGTRHVWDPILTRLEDSHDVLAVGLAGHVGGPALPAGTAVSVDALVDGVERDMDQAGFHTAHLVGNSMGGWIAFELARRGRARSVVALSPAGGWTSGSREETRLRRLFVRNHKFGTRLLAHIDRLVARPRARRLFLSGMMARGDRLDPAQAAQSVRDSINCPIYFALMDAVLQHGPPATLAGISCPVLIAWGTSDRLLPMRRYSQRLRDMIPTARWLELPKLGHVPMGDDPDLVAATIVDFAARAVEPAVAAA